MPFIRGRELRWSLVELHWLSLASQRQLQNAGETIFACTAVRPTVIETLSPLDWQVHKIRIEGVLNKAFAASPLIVSPLVTQWTATQDERRMKLVRGTTPLFR